MKTCYGAIFNTLPCLLLIAMLNTGCQTVGPGTATGGAFGTLAGGLTGAAIGATEGKSTEGALIGAVTGGTLGSIAGNATDRQNERDQLQYNNAIAAERRAAVSMHQIVQMTDNGLGKNVIISQINNQGVDRRPSIDDLIVLKNRGVDEDVIQAFQNAPMAGAVNSLPTAPTVVREPVYIETIVPRPFYGYHYRRGCRPRAGFSVNF